jgi:SAM-dependent methyltransferase
MPEKDQEKWDTQHAQKENDPDPSSFLREIFQRGWWPIGPGKALDIATGKGRNALFLAERGFEVEAVDISGVAIGVGRTWAQARSLRISWRQEDLERLKLPRDCYDLILNFNYLQRSLIPQIKTALKVGGYVIFDTYLVDQQTIGHPKNPAYLLRHNELLESFREFRVLYYREGRITERGLASFRAGILAQKPD